MDKLFTLTAFGFYGIGIVAMFAHALQKMAKGEMSCSFIEWGFRNKAKTAWTYLSCLGLIAVAILTGQVYDLNEGAHIIAAFGIGFASDSTLNGVDNASNNSN
ncbi:MAG: hypothetical protein M0Q44_01390 [Methylobacter sp.]|jgi:hypothetical protein|nr:hypothetical protein [Methylobacter sp.]